LRAAKIDGKCRFHRNQDNSPTRNRSAPWLEPVEEANKVAVVLAKKKGRNRRF